MFDRSSGIGVFLTQLPLVKAKKSSPGFTDVSIDAGTMPSSVPGACAVCSVPVPACWQAEIEKASADATRSNLVRFIPGLSWGFAKRCRSS